MPGREIIRKRVDELVHGDLTSDYGRVTHREGRKVWFENRVVTFNSTQDELKVLLDAGDDEAERPRR